MKRFLALLLLMPLSSVAQLQVERAQTENGTVQMEIRVDGVPADGVQFALGAVGEKAPVLGKADAKATDLWLLVDSSALCQSQKVDGYLNRMLRALRKKAAADTRVTLVTYTSENADVLLQNAPLGRLEEATVECEQRPMSSSYDAPLAKLLAETKGSANPLTVWVFTAGNLELSRNTALALAARSGQLDVILYNAFIANDVRPMWQSALAKRAGVDARLQVLAKPEGPVLFPSQRFTVTFAPRSEWLGQTMPLEVSARVKDAVLARAEVSVAVPLGGWARFWRQYGRWILLLTAVSLLGYAIARWVRYYRVAICAACERPRSFRQPTCLFCEAEKHAYLVGNFRRQKDGFGRGALPPAVLPLVDAVTEVGTHRRSAIRWKAAGPRETFFRLRRETGVRGDCYRLERKPYGRRVDLRVNGIAVGESRYLASGDEIRVGELSMVFRYGGATHAAH